MLFSSLCIGSSGSKQQLDQRHSQRGTVDFGVDFGVVFGVVFGLDLGSPQVSLSALLFTIEKSRQQMLTLSCLLGCVLARLAVWTLLGWRLSWGEKIQ
jgi:hypothetical protein